MRQLALVVLLAAILSGCSNVEPNAPVHPEATNEAPTLELGVTPTARSAPFEINLTLRIGDPDDDPVTWTVDWGDGTVEEGVVDAPTSAGVAVQAGHTNAPGDHGLRAEASDGNLTVVATRNFTVAPPAAPIDRPLHEVRIFAELPEQTYVEGIEVIGDRVFAGTAGGVANAVVPTSHSGQPSQIFVWDRTDGTFLETIEVSGEDPSQAHALTGLTSDSAGRLYAGSEQHGILRFSQGAGGWEQETYVTIPDLPTCAAGPAPCSPTLLDRAPLINDMTWDLDGTMYASDTTQATIWRIPPGGDAAGPPEVWYQHATFDDVFGANGLRITPDRSAMLVVETGPANEPTGAIQRSHLWRLPFPDPAGSEPEDLWMLPSDDCADGITFGASGFLYVLSICGSRLYILDEDFAVHATVENALMNFPASLEFDDDQRRLLVTNYVPLTGEAQTDDRRILDIFVDDVDYGEPRPQVP